MRTTVTQAILDMYLINVDAAGGRARDIYTALEAQGYVRRIEDGCDFEPTPKSKDVAEIDPGIKQRRRLRTGRCLVWDEYWIREFISRNLADPPPRKGLYVDKVLVRFYHWPGYYPDLMMRGEPWR